MVLRLLVLAVVVFGSAAQGAPAYYQGNNSSNNGLHTSTMVSVMADTIRSCRIWKMASQRYNNNPDAVKLTNIEIQLLGKIENACEQILDLFDQIKILYMEYAGYNRNVATNNSPYPGLQTLYAKSTPFKR